MRRVSIRELKGSLFDEVAETAEMIGVTNDRRLVAVLLPVTPEWVDQIITDHFSRLVRSIQEGKAAVATGKPLVAWDDMPPGEKKQRLPITRRVAIRELTGSLLSQAAENGEILGVMNDGRLCAVLLPVTPELVDDIIDHNLSRLVQSVAWGQEDLRNGVPRHSFDEIEKTEDADVRSL